MEAMHRLITGFPKCVLFVDSTKLQRWCPIDEVEQELKYDGHHKFYCSLALVRVDVFSLVRHIDFSDEGSDYEWSISDDSMIIRKQAMYLTNDEIVIGDTVFRDGDRVVTCGSVFSGVF